MPNVLKEDKKIKGYLAVSALEYANRSNILTETFKGEVMDKKVLFPKKLGAEHPFDFEQVQKITTNVGIINAAVDKIVDAIIGDFNVTIESSKNREESDPNNAQTIIDSFIDDSNFKVNIRPWIKEAVSKGNGIMELDIDDEKIRVMNVNNMYVTRNKKGKVLRWKQFKGNKRLMNLTREEPIKFEPKQIAHLPINKIPNDAYGIGLVWPNRVAIENYAGAEVDLHKLLSRKAGAPIHVKVGQPGESVQAGDIDGFKTDLQYMNNSTEWVTDGNIEMKLIDFSGIGDNLTNAAMHDLEQIAIGMKIPMSLLGVANNPEGLAKVNDNGFKRFINSVRTIAEEVIEDKIFQPILRKNGLSADIDFEWELQDETEKNERLRVITEALKLFDISPALRASLEIEYAQLLGLDDLDNILLSPQEAEKKAEEEQKKEEDLMRKEEETKIKQPEVPGVKPTAKQSAKSLDIKSTQTECKSCNDSTRNPGKMNITESELNNMSIGQYVNLQEIAGFNYSDYLVKILQALRIDKFNDLRALTEKDLIEGLLPSNDINKLRVILKDGFRKNKTIRQIEKDINQSIDLQDRVKIQEDGTKKLTLSASSRPITIARTETVRLANEGLKNMYIENDITSYRYLAALDDRTSDICNSLSGQVFLTKDGTPGVNMPPMHVNCRSSIVGLVD